MPLLTSCIIRIRFSFVPASLSLLFFPLVPRSQTDKLLSQKKLTVSDLKAVCEVLCLEKSGSKDELAARVVKFLADPSSDTCKKASTQAKKRKGADGTRTSIACVHPRISCFPFGLFPCFSCSSPCSYRCPCLSLLSFILPHHESIVVFANYLYVLVYVPAFETTTLNTNTHPCVGATAKKGKKAKKSKKDANKPKRAPGAFMLFSKAMRPTVREELALTGRKGR